MTAKASNRARVPSPIRRSLHACSGLTLMLAVLLSGYGIVDTANANTRQVRYQHGRIWTNPEYDGAEGWDGSAVQYPAGIANHYAWPDAGNSTARGWIGQNRKLGTYLFSTNWIDPDGNANDYASSYMFRSYDYDSYESDDWLGSPSNFNYLYPGGLQFYRRWERPQVYVNGMLLNPHPGTGTEVMPSHDGLGPYPLDIIDPNLVVEETVDMWWRYIQGVELKRTLYAYPFGSAHQDYFVMDITLTNNGISGVSNAAPVLTNQTLTGVVWAQAYDFKNKHAGEGINNYDNDARFTDPWGNGNVALYWWDGNCEELTPVVAPYSGPDWGDPQIDPAYEGHLLGNAHIMWGGLFVSESPAAPETDLGGQPSMHMITGERGLDFAGKMYSPVDPEDQRYFIASGDYQLPLDVNQRDDTWSAQWADPYTGDGATGGTALLGYGPLNAALTPSNIDDQGWTLGYGESVNIVQVVAGGGLDVNRAQEIGKSWLTHVENGDPGNTWFTADEIEEIQSGEDTVRKAVNLAYWNYYGQWAPAASGNLADWGISGYMATKPAAYDVPYNVPEAPRPPAKVAVRSVDDAVEASRLATWCEDPLNCPSFEPGIEVRWSTEAETSPDFDTGVIDFAKYIVYRQEASRLAPWEIIAVVNASDLPIAMADDEVLFEGRSFIDRDITAGLDYWYAVVAMDDGTQNWAEPGVALQSGRWWTWTGYSSDGVSVGDEYVPPEYTAVSGTITTTTWTAENSPYRVVGAINVPSGATLTIEPGVDVLFDTAVRFVVEGAIRANGTATDSVRFLAHPEIGNTWWGGLRISGGDSSSLAYTRISGGHTWGVGDDLKGGGVYVNGSGTRLTMTNSTVRDNDANEGGGLYADNGAWVSLTRCVIAGNHGDGAGGLCNASSTMVLTNCTITGNSSDSYGGGIYNPGGDLELVNCIVWGNSGPSGPEIYWGGGTGAAAYSDIGDGVPDGMTDGGGNIDADPMFVDADNGDYGLQFASPCINAGDPASPHDPDGSRADMGAFPHYLVRGLRVADVPNDDGGYVYLRWDSAVGTDSSADGITRYSVWRALPNDVATPVAVDKAALIDPDTLSWEWIANVQAAGFASYAFTAPTLYDSTSATDGIHYFTVLAHTDSVVALRSNVVAGYSVDNVCPAPPVVSIPIYRDGDIGVMWKANTESDLSHYAVYRSANTGFAASEDNLIGTTTDTAFVDVHPMSGYLYYKVVAIDLHENASPPSNEVGIQTPTAINDADLMRFSLAQNAPNPFNPRTTLQFTVPQTGLVNLVIYDANGRVVRTLVSNVMTAGKHEIVWDGTDSVGREVASGVYLYRLTAGSDIATRRMILVR